MFLGATTQNCNFLIINQLSNHLSISHEKFKGFNGKNCYCYFPGVSLSRVLSWKVCKQVTTQPENCIDDWINHWLIVDYFPKVYKDSVKGGLISKGSLISAPLPSKGDKSLSWAENLNKLLYWYGQETQNFLLRRVIWTFCCQSDPSQHNFWD